MGWSLFFFFFLELFSFFFFLLAHQQRHHHHHHPPRTTKNRFIVREDGQRLDLRFVRRDADRHLEYGFRVERHLQNGDIVLFNRAAVPAQDVDDGPPRAHPAALDLQAEPVGDLPVQRRLRRGELVGLVGSFFCFGGSFLKVGKEKTHLFLLFLLFLFFSQKQIRRTR